MVRIADSATTVPGQSFVFGTFGAASVSGSVVAFQGARPKSSFQGIFTSAVSGGGLTTVADTNTTVPGASTDFNTFGDASVSGSMVAFEGGNLHHQGIYTASIAGGPLTTIVDQTTLIPGGSGTFQTFGNPAFSGSWIAFIGSGATTGLYAMDTNGGALMNLIDVGDVLNGRTISALFFSNQGLDGSTVVFGADFTDNTSGVYSVRLSAVPEPASALLMGIGVSACSCSPVGAATETTSESEAGTERFLERGETPSPCCFSGPSLDGRAQVPVREVEHGRPVHLGHVMLAGAEVVADAAVDQHARAGHVSGRQSIGPEKPVNRVGTLAGEELARGVGPEILGRAVDQDGAGSDDERSHCAGQRAFSLPDRCIA